MTDHFQKIATASMTKEENRRSAAARTMMTTTTRRRRRVSTPSRSTALLCLLTAFAPAALCHAAADTTTTSIEGDQIRAAERDHPKLRRALQAEKAIPGDYIVEFDPSKVSDVREAANRLVGPYLSSSSSPSSAATASVRRYYEHAVHGFSVQGATHDLLEILLESEEVLGVEEDQVVELSSTVRATALHQERTDEGSWGLDFLDYPVDDTYRWSLDGTGVTVYVVDTGVYTDHEDFVGRASCPHVVPGNGGGCQDDNGHGTNVAGIVGGKIYGVAKNADIVGVKVLDGDGRGTMSSIAAGIDYIVAERQAMPVEGRNPAVINLSVGGGKSYALNDAIDRAVDEGMVVVGAAGNNAGADACDKSPGSSEAAITVGGLDHEGLPARFSNVGPCIDIWAPGLSITAASMDGRDAYKPKTGTSQAAPFVAGLAALYLQAGLSPTETKEAILRSARVVEDLAVDGAAPLAATTPNNLVTTSSSENSVIGKDMGVSILSEEAPADERTAENAPLFGATATSLRGSGAATSQSSSPNGERSISEKLHKYLRSNDSP